nr:ribonuclease H-like domain, reverse transcriptase, RNA-dependent DNA polymerase [Tanacetum cinerariifolium]
QTDYCIMKENVHTKRTEIRTWNNSREKWKMERKYYSVFTGALQKEYSRNICGKRIKATQGYNNNEKEEKQTKSFVLLKDTASSIKNARKVKNETLLFTEEEPRNYKEASTDEKWIEAIEIELDSINKNNTWTLKTLPINQKAIGLNWVYKAKRDAKGKIIKYKARLVAKGYIQEQRIDFDKVFAPVARIDSSVDISTSSISWLANDLIIMGTPRKELEVFKSQMEEKFKMSDLGLLAYYLGIEVTQTRGEITIKQTCYINKILKETSMMDSNDTKIPMDPGTKLVKAEDGNSVDATYYRSLIGSLRYLLHTRPDLSYSVGLLSRFMQDPKDHHLKAVKQVIRYIKGTKVHVIIYKKEGSCKITGYNDSSYGINIDQGKGTTGIVFYFGESPITRCTQKQPTVALSSCESKFMAATGAACQALWLKRLLSELTGWEEKRITLKVDNISAIALVRNPVFHGRSKHIDIRYHFIRECVKNGHINVEHVSGELQRADKLTKALPKLKFVTMRQMLEVVDLQTQLQYFSDVENLYRQSLGVTKKKQFLSNAVYLVSCGANDYISHVPNSISFNEGKTACCGSGPFREIFRCGGKRGMPDHELCNNITEFLFFNSLHPNEIADRQFAELFWKGDPMVTGPYNLKAVFDGKP